ncbi:MAG: hypothetical protein K5682_02135 [Lachnospiraceae bacterium]|nr:hypothetical protein [Lachnospiraceae bacterium]
MIKTQPQHVAVKSSANGISLKLDPDVSFDQLLIEIKERFEDSSAFFGGAEIALTIDGRTLSEDEKDQIGKAIEQASYLHIVSVGEMPFESTQDKFPETEDDLDSISFDADEADEADDPDVISEERTMDETFFEEDEDLEEVDDISPDESLETVEDLVESRLPDAHFIGHTMKEGEIFDSAHNIVVIGDVEAGASVVSAKNVVILGKLLGCAHAGYGEENSEHYVIALDMDPEHLQIGGFSLNDKPQKGLFGARKGAYQMACKEKGMVVVRPVKI